ncbi:MAG: hypothetical protein PHQ98_02075 [Candidatus ainarchaeum sp.]|nr:hypothetical protein [Candidatus ainarchaeum sp.]
MKISFIGVKDTQVSIFKDLSKKLSSKISGLILEERFVNDIFDIPFVALESSEDSDFIIVFSTFDQENVEVVNLVKSKLIDVELKTKVRIIKNFVEDEFSSAVEGEFYELKDKLVEDFSSKIISILFNEIDFEPKDVEFGI